MRNDATDTVRLEPPRGADHPRPANLPRSALHVTSGLLGALLVDVLPSQGALVGVAAAFAIGCWALELVRHLSPAANRRLLGLFGAFAHPHEHARINSATWYATALVLLSLTGSKTLAGLGVLVLGLGDPAAGLVGRRYGRLTLLHSRTLEGSLTFLVVAFAASLLWTHGVRSLPLGPALLVAIGSAIAGTLVELTSSSLDDNLSIPLASAAGGALGLWLAGLPIL